MHAFVVLGSFFPYQAKKLAWGNVCDNDLFFVEWDVKPQLSQTTNGISVALGRIFALCACDVA